MRFLLLATLILGGCTHAPANNPNVVQALPPLEYAAILEKNTVKTDKYSGFYQTFQADVTELNTEVLTAIAQQRGAFMQWERGEYQRERERTLQEANAFSHFFMRFYSPERDYDDLTKGKTIWKIYLKYGSSRFEGKVTKMPGKFVEIKDIFPNFDRFSTPYDVTFNVPMSTIERGQVTVVLTSSLGSAEFTFPKQK